MEHPQRAHHTKHHQEQAPTHERTLNERDIPATIIVSGILIAASIYFSSSRPPQVQQVSNNSGTVTNSVPSANLPASEVGPMREISRDDHIRGDFNADLKLVVYSDFECPFCKQFHQTLEQVISEYGQNGKLAIIYRNFPLDALHKTARKEAEAAECADEIGGNDKFWQFVDEVFRRTRSNDGLDPLELPKIATDIGLDSARFNECLSSGRTSAKVVEDVSDGASVGVRGTPHSVLVTKSGEKIGISGSQPYSALKEIIDANLK